MMKKKIRSAAVFAAFAVVLLVASCGGEGSDGTSLATGDLEFENQQLYSVYADPLAGKITFTPLTAANAPELIQSDRPVPDTADITNGKFSVRVALPLAADLMRVDPDDLALKIVGLPKNSTIDAGGAGDIGIFMLALETDSQESVAKIYASVRRGSTSASVSVDIVYYWYVDHDVTITWPKTTGTQNIPPYGLGTVTLNGGRLALKEGWNIFHASTTVSMSLLGISATVTIAGGDLGRCEWAVGDTGLTSY